MPYIDLATGARFHYEDEGSGTPIIGLHGRFGTGRADLGGIIDWLTPQGYRVLAPSLRGYGESTPKPRDYPFDFYHRDARDVLAFMDALKIERAHLLGYSDGGEVALIAAGFAPERCISVAVWGAVGYYGPAMRPVAQANYPATWMDEATKKLHGIDDPNPLVLEWIAAVKHLIDSGGDVSLSLAPNISAPVLLMLGEQDRLNPQEYGQNFIDRTPHGKLVMFKTGHGIHQQDWEGFKRVVGDFLRSASS
ncbi:MAG: alpha/beta hydrolase [Anaerolinea sp.]|nr:alpha/beta hydrolase [Anaerolinea sp.]